MFLLLFKLMGTRGEREEDDDVLRVIRLMTWNSDLFLTKNTNFIFYL